ncbi:methionyl-tRNA formyltransferase [Paenibacillus psychroresistens]|uniref:Methionyl-tRNA formyltransferase n=1 Tax=Paenibacillus psychroresistens TaxID=1778678 RepID=A0A6B8RKK0_9BACL|nr:methionyl-tRNA formyltransferase [Paenibacillus psychroresistens]QGQ96941.1 methionyl-tRNA formyltransferase [Paenibacillus psychroresistens]
MTKPKLIFMGTPDFAVPILQMLVEEGYPILAVVTQPDRPKGRKRIMTPSPVKEEALRQLIPVIQPEKLRHPDAVAQISALQPDLIVTAAYGQILPKSILELPQYGCLNVHGSLLPNYRGGAPIQRAIMNGDPVTGVTLMYMAAGLDTGDMIRKSEVIITEADNTGTMFLKLSQAGKELLRSTLPELLAGHIQAIPQDNSQATLAPNISREDEQINWSRAAAELFNQIRGLSPWPGACTLWNGENFKIWASRKQPLKHESAAASFPTATPGTVLQVTEDGIEITTGEGTLWLTEIQPSGKKAMDAAQFRLGASMQAGTILGLPLEKGDSN